MSEQLAAKNLAQYVGCESHDLNVIAKTINRERLIRESAIYGRIKQRSTGPEMR